MSVNRRPSSPRAIWPVLRVPVLASLVGLLQTPHWYIENSYIPFHGWSIYFLLMYELNLKFDVVPKSLNKALRTHRFASNRTNKTWDLLIYHRVRFNLPASPLDKAHIRLVRRFYRTLDYDGLVGSMKPVVDALVTARVLKDDSWLTLGVWEVTQEFRPKKDGAELEIFLKQLP